MIEAAHSKCGSGQGSRIERRASSLPGQRSAGVLLAGDDGSVCAPQAPLHVAEKARLTPQATQVAARQNYGGGGVHRPWWRVCIPSPSSVDGRDCLPRHHGRRELPSPSHGTPKHLARGHNACHHLMQGYDTCEYLLRLRRARLPPARSGAPRTPPLRYDPAYLAILTIQLQTTITYQCHSSRSSLMAKS